MHEISFEWNGKHYTAIVKRGEANGVPCWEVDFQNGYTYIFISDGFKWSSCGQLGFRITNRIGMELDKLPEMKRPR